MWEIFKIRKFLLGKNILNTKISSHTKTNLKINQYYVMLNPMKYSLRPKILILDLSKYGCIKSRFGIRYIRIQTNLRQEFWDEGV